MTRSSADILYYKQFMYTSNAEAGPGLRARGQAGARQDRWREIPTFGAPVHAHGQEGIAACLGTCMHSAVQDLAKSQCEHTGYSSAEMLLDRLPNVARECRISVMSLLGIKDTRLHIRNLKLVAFHVCL